MLRRMLHGAGGDVQCRSVQGVRVQGSGKRVHEKSHVHRYAQAARGAGKRDSVVAER
jgi:hypothetical protein